MASRAVSRVNVWKSNLPKPRMFLTASVADGLVCVFQGTNTFAYDPKTDRWTTKACFSPWSMGLMAATVDGIIYLVSLRGHRRQGLSRHRRQQGTRLELRCGLLQDSGRVRSARRSDALGSVIDP